MRIQMRRGQTRDLERLIQLYRSVAAIPGGLARSTDEITEVFVRELLHDTAKAGLLLVLEGEPERPLMGAIHATHSQSDSLRHVMGHLTILVHPQFQSQGYGKRIFSGFLQTIQTDMHFIMRVELRARASNERALKLYEALGFQREGRFQSRIRTIDGDFEDGIPMVWFNPKFQPTRPCESIRI